MHSGWIRLFDAAARGSGQSAFLAADARGSG
jgi:hypothetical protein